MPNGLLANNEKQYPCRFLGGLYANKDKFNLLKAENGKEAVELIESNKVDLVIANLEMPIMDGIELIAYMASNCPNIPIIAMAVTDVPSNVVADIRYKRVVSVLQRPVDSQTILRVIAKGLETKNDPDSLTTVSLREVLQLIKTEQKTCLLAIKQGKELRGEFYFKIGHIENAVCGDLSGEAAAIALLSLDCVGIEIKPYPKKKIERRIKRPLVSLITEAIRLKDEALKSGKKNLPERLNKGSGEDLSSGPDKLITKSLTKGGQAKAEKSDIQIGLINNSIKEVNIMSIQDKLKEFASIDGFDGVALYTPAGESIAILEASGSQHNLKKTGIMANAILLNAQKASMGMGLGMGDFVHIEKEQAHIIVECFNEGTDHMKTEPGKAHVHLVLVLKSDAGIGLAKMKVSSALQHLAPELRV